MSRLRPPPAVVDGTPTGLYVTGWREVWRVNSDGDANLTWERLMPRISEGILDCAVYLYRSEMDAREGESAGGSGFLVGVPYGASDQTEAVNLFRSDSDRSLAHLYAVTNCHVIEHGYPVIRLNTKEGKTKVITRRYKDWTRIRDGDDLAFTSVDLDSEVHQFRSISTDIFITKERESSFSVGLGDDTIMVGRFLNRRDKQSNLPVVRFGHISAPAPEFIDQGLKRRRYQQESFLVESHSVSGFSGSPVFVDIPDARRSIGSIPEAMRFGTSVVLEGRSSESSYFLLGVDWGHIAPGMAGVIPAWRLLDLLFVDKDVVDMRKAKEEAESKRGGATLDSSPHTERKKKTRDVEIPPISRGKFFEALGKATKRTEPD
jgi:hypothetical protein